MSIIDVTDSSFEAEVLKAPKPVLVDFWAEWCGPCRIIAASLEEISAGELGDKLIIAELDIDDNPSTPEKYGVRGIPTLIIFKDGNPAAIKIGALPLSELKKWIEINL